jgi:hypothetical protein
VIGPYTNTVEGTILGFSGPVGVAFNEDNGLIRDKPKGKHRLGDSATNNDIF